MNVSATALKFITVFKQTVQDNKLNHTCELDESSNEDYALIVINDSEQYVEIEEQETTEQGLGGDITKKCVTLTIQHEQIVHGVRYYPDGSGEPDSYDVIDDWSGTNVFMAVERVLVLNFQVGIYNYLEAWGMAEQEAENQRVEEEYMLELERDLANGDYPS